MKTLIIISGDNFNLNVNRHFQSKCELLTVWKRELKTAIMSYNVPKLVKGSLLNTNEILIYACYTHGKFSRFLSILGLCKIPTPYLDHVHYDTIIGMFLWQPRAFLIKLATELNIFASTTIRCKIVILYGIETDDNECANLAKIGHVWKAFSHYNNVLLFTTPNSLHLNPLQITILNQLSLYFDQYLAQQILTLTSIRYNY